MLWFEDEFGEKDFIFAFVNLGHVRCASDLLVECRHKEVLYSPKICTLWFSSTIFVQQPAQAIASSSRYKRLSSGAEM